jgi:hypothetical protein
MRPSRRRDRLVPRPTRPDVALGSAALPPASDLDDRAFPRRSAGPATRPRRADDPLRLSRFTGHATDGSGEAPRRLPYARRSAVVDRNTFRHHHRPRPCSSRPTTAVARRHPRQASPTRAAPSARGARASKGRPGLCSRRRSWRRRWRGPTRHLPLAESPPAVGSAPAGRREGGRLEAITARSAPPAPQAAPKLAAASFRADAAARRRDVRCAARARGSGVGSRARLRRGGGRPRRSRRSRPSPCCLVRRKPARASSWPCDGGETCSCSAVRAVPSNWLGAEPAGPPRARAATPGRSSPRACARLAHLPRGARARRRLPRSSCAARSSPDPRVPPRHRRRGAHARARRRPRRRRAPPVPRGCPCAPGARDPVAAGVLALAGPHIAEGSRRGRRHRCTRGLVGRGRALALLAPIARAACARLRTGERRLPRRDGHSHHLPHGGPVAVFAATALTLRVPPRGAPRASALAALRWLAVLRTVTAHGLGRLEALATSTPRAGSCRAPRASPIPGPPPPGEAVRLWCNGIVTGVLLACALRDRAIEEGAAREDRTRAPPSPAPGCWATWRCNPRPGRRPVPARVRGPRGRGGCSWPCPRSCCPRRRGRAVVCALAWGDGVAVLRVPQAPGDR